ncbi:MAG: hypothetical protein IJ677_08815 [Alphaproteobacteria bacterium]|nr:hypothetical protein [Alphaproteobacteria bacterium]
MRDKRCQPFSTAGQEIGIVLNNDYYVDIASILTTPVSLEEAKKYGKQLRHNLPSKKLIRLLIDNQDIVNNSLLSIGRGDCLLLGDIDEKFWTQRSINLMNDRRNVVFIIPLHKL